MLKILDKVASTVTNIIVVATTITTTLLIPLVMFEGIIYILNNENIKALISFVSVSLLIHINKSIQGGR